MMSKLFLILIIPSIYAKIQIEVVVSEDKANRSVNVSGNITDIISDLERRSFGIEDNDLKDAVKRYLDARPDDAYVRSPTPWGDLYKKYNWRQMVRTLAKERAQIIDVKYEKILLQLDTVNNPYAETISSEAILNTTVQNTVESFLGEGEKLSINEKSSYNIKTTGIGNTTFSYTSNWGKPVSKSEKVKFFKSISLFVEPQTFAQIEFYAIKNTKRILIDYEAWLTGDAAVNYYYPFKGHHFYPVDVRDLLNAEGDPVPVLQFTEVITLTYYSDDEIIFRDLKTNDILFSYPADT